MKSKTNSPKDEAYRLVYSTDPLPSEKCGRCGVVFSTCGCSQKELLVGIKPEIRIEKKGRGGKSVTRVGRLPAHERFLKELAASMKKSVGCGGTWYLVDGEGVVELQGERSAEVGEWLRGEMER